MVSGCLLVILQLRGFWFGGWSQEEGWRESGWRGGWGGVVEGWRSGEDRAGEGKILSAETGRSGKSTEAPALSQAFIWSSPHGKTSGAGATSQPLGMVAKS